MEAVLASWLANISKARRALETAKSLDDVLAIRDQAKAVETYVKAARESLGVANQAAEIKVRAERKAGAMIADMEKAKPGRKAKELSNNMLPNSKKEQLEEIGLSKMDAHRFESMARVADEIFEALASAEKATAENREITSRSIQEAARKPHVSHNSVENEWYTPPDYIQAARQAMGSIDLDPASSELAQKTVAATNYFDASSDGLSQDWCGNIFLNPPYSKDLCARFISKLVDEVEAKRVKQAILLVNNATDTAWFHESLLSAKAVCFPRGRIKFHDKTGEPANTPLQGQAFIYFGNRLKTFVSSFSQFGVCLEVLR